MKNIVFTIGIGLLAVISSCNVQERMTEEMPPITFRAIMEGPSTDPDTKAYADDGYHIFWNRGDLASIFYDKTLNRTFEYKGRSGTTAGEFERYGSDPEFFAEQKIETGYNYAIFPYDYDNACDTEGNLTVVFQPEQSRNANGVGANLFMAARAEGGDFLFKHVAAYLGINLFGSGVSVASISLKGNNNEFITGYPIVVFSEEGDPFLTFVGDPDDGKTISLVCDPPVELGASSGESTAFWIAVPPTVFAKGITMTITDKNGNSVTKKRSSALVTERKVFTSLKAAEIVIEGSDIPEVIHVESIQLDATEMELEVGETGTLSATVLPSNADDKSYSWSSSNEAVATVDANGKVTAVAVGVAVITATTTDGAKAASCTVTVKEQPVVVTYSLAISPAEASIQVSGSQTYVVTLTTVTNGESAESTVADAVLTVSDATVASVSGLVVTGTKQGTVTVTAKYTPEGSSEELSATAELTVNKDANHAGDPVEIEEGDEF